MVDSQQSAGPNSPTQLQRTSNYARKFICWGKSQRVILSRRERTVAVIKPNDMVGGGIVRLLFNGWVAVTDAKCEKKKTRSKTLIRQSCDTATCFAILQQDCRFKPQYRLELLLKTRGV